RGNSQAGRVERQHLLPLRRRPRGRDEGRRHAACGEAAGHPGRPGREIRRRGVGFVAAGGTPAHSRPLVPHPYPPPPFPPSPAPGAIVSPPPLGPGLIARNGPYQANHAARTADVLLALGVRFDDRTSSSWLPGYSFTIPPTRLIHVDIDPDEIARNYPVALGLM